MSGFWGTKIGKRSVVRRWRDENCQQGKAVRDNHTYFAWIFAPKFPPALLFLAGYFFPSKAGLCITLIKGEEKEFLSRRANPSNLSRRSIFMSRKSWNFLNSSHFLFSKIKYFTFRLARFRADWILHTCPGRRQPGGRGAFGWSGPDLSYFWWCHCHGRAFCTNIPDLEFSFWHEHG